jgi:DtxR family Mn-dependent transcriptional regulator
MSDLDDGRDREIFTLRKLGVGERARVVHLAAVDSDQLLRLSNLGIVPGVEVQLAQMRPAAVILLGPMQVALDPEITDGIWVKRVDD